jgi:hypothetical protein
MSEVSEMVIIGHKIYLRGMFKDFSDVMPFYRTYFAFEGPMVPLISRTGCSKIFLFPMLTLLMS